MFVCFFLLLCWFTEMHLTEGIAQAATRGNDAEEGSLSFASEGPRQVYAGVCTGMKSKVPSKGTKEALVALSSRIACRLRYTCRKCGEVWKQAKYSCLLWPLPSTQNVFKMYLTYYGSVCQGETRSPQALGLFRVAINGAYMFFNGVSLQTKGHSRFQDGRKYRSIAQSLFILFPAPLRLVSRVGAIDIFRRVGFSVTNPMIRGLKLKMAQAADKVWFHHLLWRRLTESPLEKSHVFGLLGRASGLLTACWWWWYNAPFVWRRPSLYWQKVE